ncbi:hypothetical protein [Thalassomonas sp. M1454]|uniref:hypothetical protein n=1 Tax=Thalassomonas sp. M1454 TaxID=2594477 RepID=UPI00117E0EA3|nr:hypothetical protein [Thalassomonas sp. M1454]TRX57063.1 hypothetical protein FNN08_06070 [Thalassomonas sp. M1454]
MKRYFYIGDNIDELKTISVELQSVGFAKPQIHLINRSKGKRYLDSITPFNHSFIHTLFKDEIIVILSLIATVSIFITGYFLQVNFDDLIILSILAFLCFLAFFSFISKSLLELETNEFDQSSIKEQIEIGRHVLLVEMSESQDIQLGSVMSDHPNIERVGIHEYS